MTESPNPCPRTHGNNSALTNGCAKAEGCSHTLHFCCTATRIKKPGTDQRVLSLALLESRVKKQYYTYSWGAAALVPEQLPQAVPRCQGSWNGPAASFQLHIKEVSRAETNGMIKERAAAAGKG